MNKFKINEWVIINKNLYNARNKLEQIIEIKHYIKTTINHLFYEHELKKVGPVVHYIMNRSLQ